MNSKDTLPKILDSLKYPDIFIPKCLLLMSLTPYFGEYEKIITQIYNYSQNLIEHTVDISDNSSKNTRSSKKTFLKRMSTREISFKNTDVNEPVEKIIENLLIELPVPPQGISTVKYFLNEEERTIKQNKIRLDHEADNIPLLTIFT